MTTSPRSVRLTLLSLVGLLFAAAAWEATSFPDRARVFPQTIALFGLAVVVVKVLLLLRRDDPQLPGGEELEPGFVPTTIGEEWRLAAPYLGSFFAYGLTIAVVGFLPASLVFVLLFLRRFDGMGWGKAAASSAAFILVLFLLARIIGLELPAGLLGLIGT